MQVLLAVMGDLLEFVSRTLFGYREVMTSEIEDEQLKSNPILEVGPQPTLLSVPHVLADNFVVGQQYYIAERDVYFYSDPVVAFDTALRMLPYGQPVHVKKLGGRWASISVGQDVGWVFKDVLAEKRDEVHPLLVPDVTYDAHNLETIKLRLCIDDEFHGETTGEWLLAEEFVTYALLQHRLQISWHHDSPRLAGTWHQKLKSNHSVYVGIHPKTHSVMEYVIEDIGHVSFVEAVFPDKSILLKEVGRKKVGQYEELTLSYEEYRELRPVFIETV